MTEEKMEPQKKLPNQKFQTLGWVALLIGSIIILLLVFQIGVYVGLKKATFSYRWGENYHLMFGGPRGGMMQNFSGQDFIQGHGTVGAIIKIDNNLLIIKSPEGVEKTINITDQTTIRSGRQDIKIANLAVNDNVVIIGLPKNDGSIDAELIRAFDLTQLGNMLPPLPGPRNLPPPNFN